MQTNQPTGNKQKIRWCKVRKGVNFYQLNQDAITNTDATTY